MVNLNNRGLTHYIEKKPTSRWHDGKQPGFHHAFSHQFVLDAELAAITFLHFFLNLDSAFLIKG